ncbi:MAG: IPT/TIG domain-containing protein [Candidatus Hydrogenedentes bacterium]|nr:IPT/TIG domain-containing protein [Candidatus Hydrogenedentota bacterium]
MRKNFLIYLIIVLLYPSFCLPLEISDWAIAITGAKTAKREKVALTAELLNLKVGISLNRETLPGSEVLSIFKSEESEGHKYLIATRDSSINSNENIDEGIFLISLTYSGKVSEMKYLSIPFGWRVEKIEVIPHISGVRSFYVVFLTKFSEVVNLGSVCLFEDSDNFLLYPTQQIPLPFSPRRILPLRSEGLWVIVGRDEEGDKVCLFDMYLKTSRVVNIEGIYGDIEDIFPLDDEYIGIVVNQTSVEGTEQCRVYAVNIWSWETAYEPTVLWGELSESENNITASKFGIWIKTESLKEGFGYLSLIEWSPFEGLTKKWETAVVGIQQAWSFSPHPSCLSTLISIGKKIDIITNEGNNRFTSMLEEDLTFSCWLYDMCFLASGGRIYKLDTATGALTQLLITQSGWVERLLPIEDIGQYEESLLDAKKIRFSKVLFDPHEIMRNFKTVVISESSSNSESWIVSPIIPTTNQSLLWFLDKREDLVLLHLGLIPNPTQYSSVYWLSLRNYPSADSPLFNPVEYIFQVKISESKSANREVLWLFGEGDENFRTPEDSQQLKMLADALASAPYYLSHHSTSTPVDSEIKDYLLVVADTLSFAKGLLSLKQISEYVRNGGSLLIIGGYYPDIDIEFLYYWLLSIGIHFAPRVLSEGDFPIYCDAGSILSHIPSLEIKNGAMLRKTTKLEGYPSANQMDSSEDKTQNLSTILVNYGKGKIGVVASKYPLSSYRLRIPKNLEFALGLFGVLTNSAYLDEDTDGDHLPDKLEDKNGNRIKDVGETNPLFIDTDGDYVPDGAEDENINGFWEEDETDPTCDDTDGDGVWDGADMSPLPTIKEVVITRIDPPISPAEGGIMALLEGRNFSQDTKFYFGRKESPFVKVLSPNRALVIVPEYQYDQGGVVDVGAMSSGSWEASGVTKRFQFSPRTELKVKKEYLEHNKCNVIIENPFKVPIHKVLILVHVSEHVADLSGTISDNRWTLEIKPIKEKWYLIVAEKKKSLVSSGKLTIQLAPSLLESPLGNKHLIMEKVWIENAYGGRFKVHIEE